MKDCFYSHLSYDEDNPYVVHLRSVMAPKPIPEEKLAQIPRWLYEEWSDEKIAVELGCSKNWAVILIEQYVKRCGHYSRIKLILEYVDTLADAQPEHPDFVDAATRVARLTPQEAKVLGALLQTCALKAVPTLPAARDLTGITIGFMNRHLTLARGPEALDKKAHWHVLVKLFYMNVLYQQHILLKRLAQSNETA
jgi:hypothetical protein